MKILILGGTGAMGVHLVKILANEGHKVFVTSRNKQTSSEKASYIFGNAHDMSFIKKLFEEEWDVVIDFMVYTTDNFKERILLLLDSCTQYIFISSARVYGDCVDKLTEEKERILDISEDGTYLLTDEYALTKARQEDCLIHSEKTNWTIVRPYITYSENRLQLGVLEKEEWLYRALQGRSIVLPKAMMSKKTTMTYGYDVARGIAAIAGNQITFGQIYHITNSNSMTWADVLDIYLNIIDKTLGFKPKVTYVADDIFFKCKPAYYQYFYDRMYHRTFDTRKISGILDVSDFTDLEKGLQSCLESFLKNRKFDFINWKLEAIKDRYTSEIISFKEIGNYQQIKKYVTNRFFFFLHPKKNYYGKVLY